MGSFYMKFFLSLATLATVVTLGLPAAAQNVFYTAEQLDQLLQPIALYPDPLLAQVLPASANPEQIAQAEQYIQYYPNGNGVDSQPWDASVCAVAHYPDVLARLAQDPNWTQSLGQAFLYQSNDVTNAIQRLRRQARSYGNLQSSPQILVTDSQNYLSIAPANPQYIYVPTYEPSEVFCPRYGYSAPSIYFSAGYSCGPWLNIGLDWLGGSCFRYPEGHYWGRGGSICDDSYNGYRQNINNYNNVSYVHNTYNYNNQAAYSGTDQNGYSVERRGNVQGINGNFQNNNTGLSRLNPNSRTGRNFSAPGKGQPGLIQPFSQTNNSIENSANSKFKNFSAVNRSTLGPQASSAPARFNLANPTAQGGPINPTTNGTTNALKLNQNSRPGLFNPTALRQDARPSLARPNFSSQPNLSQATGKNFVTPTNGQPFRQNFSPAANFSRPQPTFNQPQRQNFAPQAAFSRPQPTFNQPQPQRQTFAPQATFSRPQPTFNQPQRQNFSQPGRPTPSFGRRPQDKR